MSPRRDRDASGRPKNARPRDAMGRPLPRDASPQITEEELPSDPAELLAIGAEHFNAGRFFLAHEAWETAWHPSPEAERGFWQGITQVAVGFTHHQRGNLRGAQTLLRRGAERLGPYEPDFKGFPVTLFRRSALAAAEEIQAREEAASVDAPTITLGANGT